MASAAAGDGPLSPEVLGELLGRVTDPLYVVDRSWRLRFANPRAAELWQSTPRAVAGRSLWSVLPQTPGTGTREQLSAAMRDQRSTHFESFSSRLSGWVEVSAYPIGDGLLVLHRDVALVRAGDEAGRALAAERRAREEAERLAVELRAARVAADEARSAAEQARLAAEDAARAKGDFLATMSHELRTPINAVTGYTQLLELGVAGPVTEVQREYLDRVLTSSRHLLGLVDDVLDLARLDTGRLPVERVAGSAATIVAGALALVTTQVAARGVRVAEPAPDHDATFVGDEQRVRQILVNLLSNAVKFTPAGGTIAVEIATSVDPGEAGPAGAPGPWTTIRIRDTGIGIPPELQQVVFEPFVQADGSRTRTVGGTGLGLAVSRGLARLMGGDVTLQSEAGEGATFTLWLPTRPTDAADDPSAPDAGPPERASVVRQGHAGRRDRPTPGAGVPTTISPPSAHGLVVVGTRLRQQLESLLEGYTARLRADATLPNAAVLTRVQLEDHALSFVADLAQTLIVLEHSAGLDGDLLRDGSAIQDEIAFRHGEQRYRLGWLETHIRREYAVLRDEVETVVRQVATAGGVDVALAVSVLRRLLSRAQDVSLRGWRHAASR